MNKTERNYAHWVDVFQLQYSIYLCSLTKTSGNTFEIYRILADNSLFNLMDFELFLKEIEVYLLEGEKYEALSQFVKTNKMFGKLRLKGLSDKLKTENSQIAKMRYYYLRKGKG